jgi:16S rRNA (cytosine1402-N4)-methyltransferase
MRMDPSRGLSAREMLASADEDEVALVLRRHGDLRSAARLAREIVAEARRGGLPTTRALTAVIDRALGGRPHPRRYAQVFQALRIWVNGEAEDLDAVLAWLPDVMQPGGTVVTLAYHSGEDRRIKQSLRGRPTVGRRPPVMDAVTSSLPWDELTRRVVKPSESEVAGNPRARSARLRAFRRKTYES